VYQVIKLQLNSSIHQKCVTNFEFLQFSGSRPWYSLKHVSYEAENNFDCVRNTVSAPEGNRSSITTEFYDKRWVQIITVLTAICGGNLR